MTNLSKAEISAAVTCQKKVIKTSDLIEAAADLSISAHISYGDAIQLVSISRGYFQAVSKTVNSGKVSPFETVTMFNTLYGTSLDAPGLKRVFQYYSR